MEETVTFDGVTATLKRIDYVKNGWNLYKYIWEKPSVQELDFKEGDYIWPAGEDRKGKFTIKDIKAAGEKYFPEGGVVCRSDGAERMFFLNSIIKHPDYGKKKK